jgi:hypothetical protein
MVDTVRYKCRRRLSSCLNSSGWTRGFGLLDMENLEVHEPTHVLRDHALEVPDRGQQDYPDGLKSCVD